MNSDVFDHLIIPENSYNSDPDQEEQKSSSNSNILTRLRTSLISSSPLSSFLHNHARKQSITIPGEHPNTNQKLLPSIVTNFHHERAHSRFSSTSDVAYNGSSPGSSPALSFSSAPSGGSVVTASPPMTPESLPLQVQPSAHFSPGSFSSVVRWGFEEAGDYSIHVEDDEETLAEIRRATQIRNGKRPAPPLPYDELIADITDSNDGGRPPLASRAQSEEEWMGLSFALEQSKREQEQNGVKVQTTVIGETIGESSTSHASWASLHLGRVPPHSECREYEEWRKWRFRLDTRRARWFLAYSFEQSQAYVEEVHIRDWVVWANQTAEDEGVGFYKNSVSEQDWDYAEQQLEMIAIERPDPYYPPQKHNTAWLLKRSRSVGCIRDLRACTSD